MKDKSIIKYILRSCVLFLLCTSCAYGSKPLCIESVLVRHYAANDFFRISEFFTGRENTGGDTILRTNEAFRAGIYLVVELNKPLLELGEDAQVKIQYILSDCRDVKKQDFEIKKLGFTPWLFVGVTGTDYHGRCQNLLAWRVEIYSNGQCVTQESYLWKMNQEEENCAEAKSCAE